jgi:hypothetical protein
MFGDWSFRNESETILETDGKSVNLYHLSSCDLLHKDESISVPFPSARVVEVTDSLAENIKMRFNDFVSMPQTYVVLKAHSLLNSTML